MKGACPNPAKPVILFVLRIFWLPEMEHVPAPGSHEGAHSQSDYMLRNRFNISHSHRSASDNSGWLKWSACLPQLGTKGHTLSQTNNQELCLAKSEFS